MKVFFKRMKVEYDEIEIDASEIDYHFGGDILLAVKGRDYGSCREFDDYQILDYQLNEAEKNKNILDKGFEDICKYRNNEELDMYRMHEDERIRF